MTISFFEPGDVPQPPDNVKIEHLKAVPYADGWRVKIEVNVTPFLQRPNLEIVVLRTGEESKQVQVASLSIVETMHPRMEFTIHIRGVEDANGRYQLRAALYYRDQVPPEATEQAPMQIKDTRQLEFNIPAVEEPES